MSVGVRLNGSRSLEISPVSVGMVSMRRVAQLHHPESAICSYQLTTFSAGRREGP